MIYFDIQSIFIIQSIIENAIHTIILVKTAGMINVLAFLANFGLFNLISIQFLTFLTNHTNVAGLLALKTTGEMVFHEK